MELILALGSNLGNRVTHLERAVGELSAAGIRPMIVSSCYETVPVEVEHQPAFVNCVGIFQANGDVFGILETVLEIEQKMGRIRRQNKGPRIIDIDIISCDQIRVHTVRLKLPHPAMGDRKFVLVPLLEIDGDRVLPVGMGCTVRDLVSACDDRTSNPVLLSGAQFLIGT